MKRLLILMAASAAIFCSCSQKGPDPVEVEGGRVSGYVEDGIRIYKGIPFAAPPVGELRWKAPQDVIPWEGVLEATQFAPAPVQPAKTASTLMSGLRLRIRTRSFRYWYGYTAAASPWERPPTMTARPSRSRAWSW